MERLDPAFRRMQRDTLHGAFWWGVLAAAFATVLALSFVISPNDIASGAVSFTPPCPMKMLLQRDCPTCGMTRAFAALGHGHWHEALAYNRAAPLVFLGCFAAMLFGVVGLYRSICAYRRALPRRVT